jgi:hypothetical protein
MPRTTPARPRSDWNAVARDLDADGFARLPALLDAAACRTMAALYDRDPLFRSTVDMARHGYGRGEYRYFAAPVPAPVARLRTTLYPPLAAIARDWARRLGRNPDDYPPTLAGFLARCHAAGQRRPTPLLLRYHAGDWNALHQDNYGAVAFPLQVVVLLTRPGRDHTGGELVLVEQRPRAQARARVVPMAQGEGIVFTNRERPVAGTRGDYRVAMRHGVSTLAAGRRLALGIIFHDAE